MRFRRLHQAGLLILILAMRAWPSECVEPSQSQSFKRAKLVFEGRVARVDMIDAGTAIATIEVARVWKGPVAPVLLVAALKHPAFGSGFTFEAGATYVVYAHADVNQDRAELQEIAKGATVYGLHTCGPRARTDIAAEEKLLGSHWRKP